MPIKNKCFNCGKYYTSDYCPHCNYKFSLEFLCPKRINEGIVCAVSKKICKHRGDIEQCPLLR